jgi:hypothetical protein
LAGFYWVAAEFTHRALGRVGLVGLGVEIYPVVGQLAVKLALPYRRTFGRLLPYDVLFFLMHEPFFAVFGR